MDPDLLARLEAEASKQQRSVNQCIGMAVERWLNFLELNELTREIISDRKQRKDELRQNHGELMRKPRAKR